VVDLGVGDIGEIPGLLEYPNVPRLIGNVISSGKATLHECETIYSTEDLYFLLEVVSVDAHNKAAAHRYLSKRDADK